MPAATQDAAMPRRAYSYTRFSKGTQAHGDSERRQTEWPAVVCAENGWTLDDTLSFVDRGRSGFHGRNLTPTAGLTQFRGLVERGRIARGSVLIVENIDRLSRQDVDTAHDLFRSIIKAGVWICTRVPPRVYRGDKEASFMDLLEPIWIMYVAYMESLKKSQRGAEAWAAARQAAAEHHAPHNCQPPAWVRRDGDAYALIPDRAAAVRRMADLCRSGVGVYQIAAALRRDTPPCASRAGTPCTSTASSAAAPSWASTSPCAASRTAAAPRTARRCPTTIRPY